MIENYSITEWIAFFFIYSFLGWVCECIIVLSGSGNGLTAVFSRPLLPDLWLWRRFCTYAAGTGG